MKVERAAGSQDAPHLHDALSHPFDIVIDTIGGQHRKASEIVVAVDYFSVDHKSRVSTSAYGFVKSRIT